VFYKIQEESPCPFIDDGEKAIFAGKDSLKPLQLPE